MKDQIHVYRYNGTNYLVNGHNRLAIATRDGIPKLKGINISTEYLQSKYLVTPEQLVGRSNEANRIGNRIRWR